MGNGASDRKLGIVTFNNEVTVFGDGQEDPQTIAGDKLYDYDFLIENGAKQGDLRMKHKVNESQKKLTDKLMSLEETGPTALGPAIATSIAMAAQGAPGSQVVICTDGLANVGLGAFDEAKTEEQMAKIDEFYERLGQYAKSKGLTINIVSIIGDECNLDSLSKLAELTGGNVERVDPASLTQNFANILAKPIIATNVVLKVKLHKGLQFRNEQDANMSEDKSLMVRDVGNVTESCEITFEYTLKKISDIARMEDIDLSQLKDFPFQTQITYKALDGSKCIRVISMKQGISSDREELEKNANFNLIGTHAIQQSSKFAKVGNFRGAQAYAKNWNRKMRGNTVSAEQEDNRQQFVENFDNLYNNIGKADQEMSDAEDGEEEGKYDEEDVPVEKKKGGFLSGLFGGARKEKAKQSAPGGAPQLKSKKRMNDELSVGLFQASKMNASKMSKKK
jgi:hypothetical protein